MYIQLFCFFVHILEFHQYLHLYEQLFDVQIITADNEEEKLIVSEKAVFEKEMEKREVFSIKVHCEIKSTLNQNFYTSKGFKYDKKAYLKNY